MPTHKHRRRKPSQENNPAQQEILYTPAKTFQSRRFLLYLVTVFAVVLVAFMSISVFFKVSTVKVSGVNKYSAEEVAEASGIDLGDSLLFFGKAGAVSRIRQNLPYIQDVRFGIELPGTVTIIVEEIPVVYAIQDTDSQWWLMSAEGKITEKADASTVRNCTHIIGVRLASPAVGAQAAASEPEAADPSVPVVITGADRLKAALAVVQQLEANQIIGKVTSVDVANPGRLQVQYGSNYLVKLGSTDRLDYKLAAVKEYVESEKGRQGSGTIDATFDSGKEELYHLPPELDEKN